VADVNCDTRLTSEVLESLGFERRPAEDGEPTTYRFLRYSHIIDVTVCGASYGAGWDLEGMKPATVGDLLVMIAFAGAKQGRRDVLYGMLENVEVQDVFNWVRDVKNLKFVDKDESESRGGFTARERVTEVKPVKFTRGASPRAKRPAAPKSATKPAAKIPAPKRATQKPAPKPVGAAKRKSWNGPIVSPVSPWR
jgi:hypothetical protein